jgi:RNA polymerase sigma-70 factor (ECF subfamily)
METSEANVVQRAVAGNAQALVELLQRNHTRVLAFIDHKLPRSLRGYLDPRDILQDTYFNAIRAITTLESDTLDSFERWLLSIARNQIINANGRQKAARRRVMFTGGNVPKFADESMVLLLEELSIYERTPSRSAIIRETMAMVGRALEQLPEQYRTALRLRYFERMSPGDMAPKMSRTERAIHELCHRALKALRHKLRSASHYM